MAEQSEADIMIAARVDKALYAKILKRRRKIKELTGIEPSVSAVVRSMISEATLNDEPVRRHHHPRTVEKRIA